MLYAPDVKKWEKFYDDMVNGKLESRPISYNTHARGGEYLIPIENRRSSHVVQDDDVKIKMVSPAQMALEQVKSEIKRDAIQKGNKRKRNHTKKQSVKKRHSDNIDVFSKQ